MPAVPLRGLPIATRVEWDLAESHDTSRLRRGRRTITTTALPAPFTTMLRVNRHSTDESCSVMNDMSQGICCWTCPTNRLAATDLSGTCASFQ